MRSPRLTTSTVRVRGLDFHVRRSPEVPGTTPLLCVNGGLLFDHASMWPTMAPLARQRQVILYDQRGRGRTQPPPGVRAARIEHDGGDVAALREALGIERWDILGHSWGGGISMLGASLDPAGVRRLVLVDSVGPNGSWLPGLHSAALERLSDPSRSQQQEHAELAALDPLVLREPDPAVHARYSRAFSPAWFANPAIAHRFTPKLVESPTGAAVASRLRREGYDWAAKLRALRPATLVIHGERDLIPLAVAESLAGLIPDARLEVIPDAGHMPFWEQPQHFFPIVERFLA
jgi:proline iminopeptidase